MHITINNSLNFKSGLSSKIVQMQKDVNVSSIENFFKQAYSIETNFKMNRPVALSSFFAVNILENAKLFLKNFNLTTPEINVYKKGELITSLPLHNFCIPENSIVTNENKIYPKGSIFYEEQKSLEEMDALIEKDYIANKRSSGHFLADTIHEMMHSIYLNHLEKIYKNDFILKDLEHRTLSDDENIIIAENIGKYATTAKNQYHEIFAETFTKLFCNAISPQDLCLKKNPIEELKKYPKDFQKIIKKIIIVD